MASNFEFGCVLVFFHAKSDTTNIYWNGSSDHIKNFCMATDSDLLKNLIQINILHLAVLSNKQYLAG